MEWHFRLGYAVLSLLLFRFLWGFIGGQWSRFSSFVYSPVTVMRYLRGQGQPEHVIGHNPLGAISVFLLLGLLLLQVATGLISDDEIAATGPFAKYVSEALVRSSTYYHKVIGTKILYGLAALHLAAILFYLLKRGQNLTPSMFHGDKKVTTAVIHSRDDARSRIRAILVLLACMLLVTGMVLMA
jgi:cytochrome b